MSKKMEVAENVSAANGIGAASEVDGLCSSNLKYDKRYYRIAICIFFFLQGTTFATWAARIPDFKQMLSLNDAQLGSVLLLFPLGQLLGIPIAGYLVQKYTSRKILLCVALLYPLTLVVIGLANSVVSLSVVLFFLGMVANLHNLSVNTQAVGVEKIYGRSIMATFHGLWSLAGFAAGLTGSFLVANSVIPLWHFVGIFCFAVIVVLVLHRFVLENDISSEKKEKATFNVFKGMNNFVLLLGFLAFGSMLCEGCVYDWSSVYFGQEMGIEDKYIRAGYTGCMLAMAGMRFLADGFVNRLGAVKVVGISGFVTMVGFLLVVFCPYLIPATIGFVLVGIGVSSVVPVCYGMASSNHGMSAGRAINAVSTIGFFGFVIGPPIVGYISELASMKIAFALIAVLGLSIGLLARKLKVKE